MSLDQHGAEDRDTRVTISTSTLRYNPDTYSSGQELSSRAAAAGAYDRAPFNMGVSARITKTSQQHRVL